MKIIAIGDIHGNLVALECVIREVSEMENKIIVLTGDLYGVINPEYEYLENFQYILFNILRYCILYNVKIFYVLGNHDLPIYIPDDQYFINCDFLLSKKIFNNKGYSILGLGGSNKIGFTIFEWDEKNIVKLFSNQFREISNLIFLSHVPPYGTNVDRHKITHHSIGSKAVKEIIDIYSPRICICGHIHEGVGVDFIRNTLVVNCGEIIYSNDIMNLAAQYYIIDLENSDDIFIERHVLSIDDSNDFILERYQYNYR